MKIILNGRKFATVSGIAFDDSVIVRAATTTMGEVTLDVSTTEPTLTGGLLYAERELAAKGHRIAAIKSIRERTGMGLKDSKDLVDREVPHTIDNSTVTNYVRSMGYRVSQ